MPKKRRLGGAVTRLFPKGTGSARRWRFLEDAELPNIRLKRKKIQPEDDLPMTESGDWLIRKDFKNNPWSDYVNWRMPPMQIQPPAGWNTDWANNGGESSIFFPQHTHWTSMMQVFEVAALLERLKEAGISGWVPVEKRKSHLEESRVALAGFLRDVC